MSKDKPDYTMFMKKPAPLATRFPAVPQEECAEDRAGIPMAEIMAEHEADAQSPPQAPAVAAPVLVSQRALRPAPPAQDAPRDDDPLIEDFSSYAFLKQDTSRSAFPRLQGVRLDYIPAPLLPMGFTVLLLAALAASLA